MKQKICENLFSLTNCDNRLATVLSEDNCTLQLVGGVLLDLTNYFCDNLFACSCSWQDIGTRVEKWG